MLLLGLLLRSFTPATGVQVSLGHLNKIKRLQEIVVTGQKVPVVKKIPFLSYWLRL